MPKTGLQKDLHGKMNLNLRGRLHSSIWTVESTVQMGFFGPSNFLYETYSSKWTLVQWTMQMNGCPLDVKNIPFLLVWMMSSVNLGVHGKITL